MLLYILITAFTIWMIIDAAKRRAEYYWFLIIIFFAPLGGLVYFFVVKLKDLRPAGGEPVVAAKPVGPSLGQLRELALESPSIANRLAYGDALRESVYLWLERNWAMLWIHVAQSFVYAIVGTGIGFLLFDKPLAAYQLTQAKLADMALEVGKGHLLAYQLGRLKDAGEVEPAQVSLGKLNNCREAIKMARECRTILGANGITLEYPPIRPANKLESVLT